MDLQKKYDPKSSEARWQQFWEDEGIFRFDPKSKKAVFSVDSPPATVSGKMHIGHSFSYSQQDFIMRFQRMAGKNVFCPFGTDDNGLATERLVEKINNVREGSMSRNEFRDLCMKTLEKIRPNYVRDWKKIGFSADYNITYSTINDHCRRISQKSFIDLYKKKREYRKESPTLWCPHCHMALAQVELEDRSAKSVMNHIVFKVGNKDLIIATTRPELLPACVAVFYHPSDKRYKKLKAKKAVVPLFNLEVPILEDERADPEKGTGIVMCCTFGDQTDMEWYFAHKLDLRMALTTDGRMNELCGKYKGMKITEAREKVIEDLKNAGLLVKQEPVDHIVNVHERCKTEIEIMHTKQWFIKYLDLKGKFLKAGNELKWYPDHMKNRFDNWVKGLQWDWCISRQRPFGVPIPVWYCKKCGKIIIADESQLPVDPLQSRPLNKCRCGSDEFEPEKDVLDTWATSSLTPQIAAELFTDMKKKLYPMSLRPQAHDIISFWLFNTLAKSQIHNNINPWKDVMISGWALDPHGKKMSKSKGNIVEPHAVLEKYSADAMRFWAAGSKLGDDMPYQEKELVTGTKTMVKLWNAAKFAVMNLEGYKPKPVKLETIDKWVLTKLSMAVKACTDSFNKYEYSRVRSEAETLFWHVFTDYYIEIVKDRLYNTKNYSKSAVESAKYTLYKVLLDITKLFAPIMPHITEEIYQLYFKQFEKSESIHISEWPRADKIYKKEGELGDLAVDIIAAIRKYKTDKGMSMNEPIKKVVIDGDVKPVLNDIKSTMKIENIKIGKTGDGIETPSGIKIEIITE